MSKRLLVYHGSYGCETGCCGHFLEWDDGTEIGGFTFSHPYGTEQDFRDWAREFITDELGAEHVADLDWDNSVMTSD